jgi:hypothetical protein
LRTHVEPHPRNLSYGRNKKKTLQIARTKIGAKNTFKNQENKNISTHIERDRWFNLNPLMYWCKSRVYKIWKPPKQPLSLWKIGDISHFSHLFSKIWSTPTPNKIKT